MSDQLTNVVIRKPSASININKSFSRDGLDFNREVNKRFFTITDNPAEVKDEVIEKATVKSHTRKTKSGKLSNVKQYEDSRTKKLLVILKN